MSENLVEKDVLEEGAIDSPTSQLNKFDLSRSNVLTSEVTNTSVMGFWIKIEVIGKAEEIYDTALFKFSSEDTVWKIKEQVRKKWRNFSKFDQRLYFNGTELLNDDNTLGMLKMNEGDTIRVKHALMAQFELFLIYFETFKSTKADRLYKENAAIQGLKLLKFLVDNEFFFCFSRYIGYEQEALGPMTRFIDTTVEAIRKSASNFFVKQYPQCEIKFYGKDKGSRSGTKIEIRLPDEKFIYFVKTYHGAGASSISNSCKRNPCDLKELFCYKLFHFLGVGPYVVFPHNEKSAFIYYIATLEVKGFKDMEAIADEGNLKNFENIIFEAHMLTILTGIKDLHDNNLGIGKEKTLQIVDFAPSSLVLYSKQEMADALYEKSFFYDISKCNAAIKTITNENKKAFGEAAIARWYNIKNISLELVENEKNILKEYGIKFKSSTEDLIKYIDDIKTNFENLNYVLNGSKKEEE